VAGLAAGLDLVQAPLVAVLACDLPFVTSDTVQALIAALEPPDGRPVDGAQLVDELGHRQPLAAVYRTERLRGALYSLLHVSNASMRAMLGGVTMVDVAVPREQAWDCDTWADLDRARQRVDENPMEEP
jgi:molybdopterin-guanine dinucleotide biosynthesis protein A